LEAAVVAPWLWIVFTLVAAAGQVVRNLLQRGLTKTLGTAGATHVRFLYGLPFGILFLATVLFATGVPLPLPGPNALAWTFMGAMTQIAATALLLMAMQGQSFVVVTAYIKTEPVLVAFFGLVLLGDPLTVTLAIAIGLATAGVLAMSWPRGGAASMFAVRPTLFGIAAAALFGLSSVGFRGGINALGSESYIVNASTTLVMSLTMQTVVLSAWLAWREPQTMRALLAGWRTSLAAGFMGAFASQAWFLAFAVESAARVRTLALVEIIFAQFLAGGLLRERAGPREWLGIALVVLGVVLLLNG
jgi:drug/metabolite transporter (DMT)-like permease